MMVRGWEPMKKRTEFLGREKERKCMVGKFQKLATPLILAALIGGPMLLSACTVGPKYQRPSVQVPAAYKELTPDNFNEIYGWKVAQPKDDVIRGRWWEMFNDPELNTFEEQVNISNQNIAAAAASFRVARALVKQARSEYFPTVITSPTITQSRQSSGGSQSSFLPKGSVTNYSLPFDASWELDLWGRIQNTVKANASEAQATATDLENVRLTVQAEVVVDYYQIRALDSQKQLFDSTVISLKESLELTQVRYQTGIASDEDVAQAETQLETTQAQDTDLGVQRAQFEHAIALLVGKPASTFSIHVEPLKANPPAIPLGVPSQLLERRPDIAAAERRVAEANAQIGVAKAAYFPTISLSASAGFQSAGFQSSSTSVTNLFTWPTLFWSVGSALAQTLFDAGLRKSVTEQALASYDGTVATYRQTVLTAFQQVEDNLAALRILSQELQQQDAAVKSSERFLTLANDRYKLGIDSYLNVIIAQGTLLSNQRTAVGIRMQLMTASVQLIEALGGGWDASQIPSSSELVSKTPQNPKSTP
jgi:NodT family efflux transporter outer membrane factor (OMF) lipoprotein